jgi:hypothetical protein
MLHCVSTHFFDAVVTEEPTPVENHRAVRIGKDALAIFTHKTLRFKSQMSPWRFNMYSVYRGHKLIRTCDNNGHQQADDHENRHHDDTRPVVAMKLPLPINRHENTMGETKPMRRAANLIEFRGRDLHKTGRLAREQPQDEQHDTHKHHAQEEH